MPRKIKNILIEPQFQLKFLFYFFGLFVITTVTLYSTTFLFFWRLKSKALAVGIPENHVFFRFLENQKHDLDLLFIALAFLNLLLLIYFGFKISHRVAGPFYKIKKYLSVFSSESEEFRLRKKDFFKDIEPIINNLRKK